MNFPYTIAQVIAAGDAIRSQQEKLAADISVVDEQLSALQRQKRELVSARQAGESRLVRLANVAIAIQDAPEEVLALRRHWKALRKAAARDDIKVSTMRRKIEDAKSILHQLRFTCPHPFVLERDGTRNDCDGYGATPALRTCATCGTEEDEWQHSGPRKEYRTLAFAPGRIVMRFLGSTLGKKSYEQCIHDLMASDDPRELLFDERMMERLRQDFEAAVASKTPA